MSAEFSCREEKNRQPVEPVEFPERSPVLAQLGFQMCSGSSLQQRSVLMDLDVQGRIKLF